MKKNITVKAEYYVTGSHPDIEYISDIMERQEFNDVYSFDTDYCGNDTEIMIDYIIHDILLVISGGYQYKESYFNSITIYANNKIVYGNYPVLRKLEE